MKIEDININSIKILDNIRQYPIDKELPNLMQSIKDYGILQPIGVKRTTSNTFELIWGFRRLSACRKLGYKTISAVIFLESNEVLSEEEFFLVNATENLQRSDNNLKEFGRICSILKRTMSDTEIAKKLSTSPARVRNALSQMNRIPKKWQNKIRIMNGSKQREGDIPLSIAGRISSFVGVSKEDKEKLYNEIAKNDMNFVKVTYIVSLLKKGIPFNKAKEQVQDYMPYPTTRLLIKKNPFFNAKGDKTMEDLVIDILNSYFKDDNFAIKVKTYVK